MHCPVRHWARLGGHRLALQFGDRRWTYEQLDGELTRWTAVLRRHGAAPGSRIALLSANRPELIFLIHALGRLRTTVVPLNVRLTRPELQPLIERVSPTLVVAEERWRGAVGEALTVESMAEEASRSTAEDPQIAEPEELDSPLAILFTSGTTGAPKGAVLTRENFRASAKASAANLGGDADQRWLACLPLYHVGGLAMLLRASSYGAGLVLHPRFDADAVIASLEGDGITHLSLVENALAQVLSGRGEKRFATALRAVLVGGGPVAASLLQWARAASMPVLQTYGLTEATSQVTTERLGAADGRTAGSPLQGVEVRTVDGEGKVLSRGEVGEIEVRGPIVMRGYWADAAATAQVFRSGWLRTQDLGALDEDGRLIVIARRTDLIVSGGENIYPAEVERTLATHAAIAEVAVVPRDDARWGQVPIAALVLRAEIDVAAELPKWCRVRLAAFKIPRQWLTFQALPRNGTGKVDRLALRAMVEGTLRRSSTMAAPSGEKITLKSGKLAVPDRPIIPYIEGDGTGRDIWRASQAVFEAAVEKAYGGKRKIVWHEVLAGEKAFKVANNWLPDATVEAFRAYLVGIKGPLTTPIGGGIRSLNVALRQLLDLYVCLRPVRYFKGVPSPVKAPEKVDMVIFRENTEDIYAGIEFESDSDRVRTLLGLLKQHFPKDYEKIRFPETSGIGIKPVSKEGTERLVRAAIKYALEHRRRSVSLVHKGNIMKFTEGAFRKWGYELAAREFKDQVYTWEQWEATRAKAGEDAANAEQKRALGAGKLLVKDSIADITLQQVLTRPDEFDVIATPNLNGDYLSDALAAQVGGIGIAPGGNINYVSGHAIFEATHGTAPKYADQDKVNPGSVILSGEMMLRHLGWNEAADLITRGMDGAISAKTVTYDFARLMKQEAQTGVTEVKSSEFGQAVIQHMR